MPAEFEACVRQGGRVRTKTLPDGKFMRICFINGQSFAGEVRTKKAEREMDLSLTYKFTESTVNKEKRTVLAGIIEEDVLSENGRFYPAKVVREAVARLGGKRSLIGHDTHSPMDVVAVIERAEMVGKRAVGHFRFGTDTVSEMMLTKIKDGLVDSFSIRASGASRRGKIEGMEEPVDIVTELEIHSVDLVTDPGIKSAKVIKVLESASVVLDKEITQEEMEMAELELIQKELDESNQKIKELEEKAKKAEQENLKLQDDKRKAEVERHIAEKLATVTDEETRKTLKDGFIGKTAEEFDVYFTSQVKLIESLARKSGKPIELIIQPTDAQNQSKVFNNLNDLLESSILTGDEKLKILKKFMGSK